MLNNITVNNPSRPVLVVVPCALTAAGIVNKLHTSSQIKGLVKIIKRIDEAYSGILKVPDVVVILNISESSSLLAGEIKFINWCRTVQPSAVIVAYTRNHKISVLNYIAALGVRIIISQYEPTANFTDLVNKSFNSKVMLCSPIVKSILDERITTELTVCEVQVIGQLFLGHNVSQVAHNLGRDIRTVSAHKRHAMEKLGLTCEKDLHVLGCELSGK
jgi:two-component system capsular synthesis response regulator RcsB